MIEGIQVARDVTIILAAIIIATMTVLVGVRVLDLTRKVDDLRVSAVNLVTMVANPIKGVMRMVGGRKR